MSRVIKVYNQETNQSISLTSSATTWAELRSEINNNGTISANNKTAIIKETKATLGFEDSILPEGDFTLFLFPVKVKSGVTPKKNPIGFKKPVEAKKSAAKAVKADNSVSYKELEKLIQTKTKVINSLIKDSVKTLKQRIETEFEDVKKSSAKTLAQEAKEMMKKMA